MNSWKSSSSHSKFRHRERCLEHISHKKKLKKVQPIVDNKSPRYLSHLILNPKIELSRKQREKEIVKQNKILSEKLKKVASNSPPPIETRKLYSRFHHDEISNWKHIQKENKHILRRLKSAKPYYPAKTFRQNYKKNQYLALKISENAQRVPQSTSYAIDLNSPKLLHTIKKS